MSESVTPPEPPPTKARRWVWPVVAAVPAFALGAVLGAQVFAPEPTNRVPEACLTALDKADMFVESARIVQGYAGDAIEAMGVNDYAALTDARDGIEIWVPTMKDDRVSFEATASVCRLLSEGK